MRPSEFYKGNPYTDNTSSFWNNPDVFFKLTPPPHNMQVYGLDKSADYQSCKFS